MKSCLWAVMAYGIFLERRSKVKSQKAFFSLSTEKQDSRLCHRRRHFAERSWVSWLCYKDWLDKEWALPLSKAEFKMRAFCEKMWARERDRDWSKKSANLMLWHLIYPSKHLRQTILLQGPVIGVPVIYPSVGGLGVEGAEVWEGKLFICFMVD